MIVPFLIFWFLLFFAREDLQFRGIMFSIGILVAMYFGVVLTGISPLFLVVGQTLLDIALILIIYGGDLRIR